MSHGIPKDLGITPEERKKLDDVVEEAISAALPSRDSFYARVADAARLEGLALDIESDALADEKRDPQTMEIGKIAIGDGRRRVDRTYVAELAASIREVGLLNAITVTRGGVLVAGNHRLEACKSLGWTTIPVHIVDLDELHGELAQIDENLVRNDLSVLERSEHLARRKRVYEAIHPEAVSVTKRGGPGRGHKKTTADTAPVSFASDTAAKTGIAERTIQEDVQIADKIPQDVRDKLRERAAALTKIDLMKLARMPKAAQREIASMVSAGKVKTVGEGIRAYRLSERHEHNAATAQKNLPLDEGGVLYNLVYCDPPWRYEHSVSVSRDPENHYPTMTLDDIRGLRVNQITTDDAIMFMWAPPSKLAEALSVIESWGFSYRTCMVWDKESIGPGYFVRQQVELLLIAAKGKPPVPAEADRPASVFRAPRGEHSAKPEAFYGIIARMYPKAHKVELFARAKRDGWTVWGNEAYEDKE